MSIEFIHRENPEENYFRLHLYPGGLDLAADEITFMTNKIGSNWHIDIEEESIICVSRWNPGKLEEEKEKKEEEQKERS